MLENGEGELGPGEVCESTFASGVDLRRANDGDHECARVLRVLLPQRHDNLQSERTSTKDEGLFQVWTLLVLDYRNAERPNNVSGDGHMDSHIFVISAGTVTSTAELHRQSMNAI